MDFREAERRFRTIDSRYRAGEMSAEEYQAQLYQLQVTDEMGRPWMMQESTGRWYVFEGGRWETGSPPRGDAVARRPPAQPAHSAQASAGSRARPRWLVVGGVALAVAACAGMIVAGALLWPQLRAAQPGPGAPGGVVAPEGEEADAPTTAAMEGSSMGGDGEETLPPVEWTARETVPVAADGSPVSDGAGAALEVPADSLAEDRQAQLEVYEPEGALFDALEETYVFETGFYAATAAGPDDGVGRATLQLPAAGPDSRVLAVVDGQTLVMMDVEPEDGVLTLNPRLGASESGGGEVVDGLGMGGTDWGWGGRCVTPWSIPGRIPEKGGAGRGTRPRLGRGTTADGTAKCITRTAPPRRGR